MADLLIELLSEEIPHTLQSEAAIRLCRDVCLELSQHFDGSEKEQLLKKDHEVFFGPRRIAVLIKNLPTKTDEIIINKKGPKVDLDKKVILNFTKSNGIDDISKLKTFEKKGSKYYYFSKTIKARELIDILPKTVAKVVENFTWARSMKLGFDKFSWIRPLKNILVMLDDKAVEGMINLNPDILRFSDHTYGHRFLKNPKIKLTSASDYSDILQKNKVIVCQETRKEVILTKLEKIGRQEKIDLKIDNDKLLLEVCNLVEYPHLLLLDLPKKYLSLPFEVLEEVLGSQQKYFFFKNSGNLVGKFLLVANHLGCDKGETIKLGNLKVLRARLDDALFFIKMDRKNKLIYYSDKLKEISFYPRLGSIYDRTTRIEGIAKLIYSYLGHKGTGCNFKELENICRLAKCDLVTEMVGEFPKLQGVMAAYYASLDGYNKTVTEVIKHQYCNQDYFKKHSVSHDLKLYLLAENFELLIGFFLINELPTGSRDPFALRRAALTLVEILVGYDKEISLTHIIKHCMNTFDKDLKDPKEDLRDANYLNKNDLVVKRIVAFINTRSRNYFEKLYNSKNNKRIINAVIRLNHDDINLNYQTIEVLSKYLMNTSGSEVEEDPVLIYVYRRCSNIIRQAKQSDLSFVDESLFVTLSEKDLYSGVKKLKKNLNDNLAKRQLDKAIIDICKIEERLDSFFDENEVNHKNINIRRNRLSILKGIIDCYNLVADFNQII